MSPWILLRSCRVRRLWKTLKKKLQTFMSRRISTWTSSISKIVKKHVNVRQSALLKQMFHNKLLFVKKNKNTNKQPAGLHEYESIPSDDVTVEVVGVAGPGVLSSLHLSFKINLISSK